MMGIDVIIVGAGPAGAMAARACASGGLRATVIEKKRIPRHKACSGILIPESLATLERRVGPLPESVFSTPRDVKAMRFHFRGGGRLDAPVGGWMVWRDRFDAWLCGLTGAEILEGTTLTSFEETVDGVRVFCSGADGRSMTLRCRALIAADGGYSSVVRRIDAGLHSRLSWYVALQDTCEGGCDLEPGYFNFYAVPEISLYSSAYLKDGFVVTDVVVRRGEKALAAMERFKTFLRQRAGFEERRLLRRLGCPVTYAAPRGLFCFGTDRVLVAGEASGLLNLFGEGISPALASGTLAGEAAVRGLQEDSHPGPAYRRAVHAEKVKTLRTFDYKRLLFGRGSFFDWKSGLGPVPWRDRLLLFSDLMAWFLKTRTEAKK